MTDTSPEPTHADPPNRRRFILPVVGLLFVSCLCLSATGILNFNLGFYAGGYSIEDVIVTDELGPDGKPVSRESTTVFAPTSRINTAVYTSSVDATIGMRWYHEGTLIVDIFERTRENYLATYIEGQPHRPLASGAYRVDVHIGRDSPPEKTVRFTVEDLDLEVVPSQPTPEGHVDIEDAPYLEVPFAFDETWHVDGQEWRINEVKIVFLEDQRLFVVVVATDLNLSELSDQELKELTRPVAQYALDNSYWEYARQIEINGETYPLTEPLAITLVNPDTPGQGHRVRFDINALQETE